MNRIAFYLFSFLILACNKKETVPPPNIIVILADDLGYGDISVYQPENKIKTPHIDQIAANGIQFTDAHSASSVCTPTRYALLTGRYNWRSRLKRGVLTGKSKALIPKTQSTLASMLKQRAYHTAFIGKWHLGWNWGLKQEPDETGEGWNEKDFVNIDFSKPVIHTPNDLGFDYAYGHSGSLDMAPYVYVENGKATAVPDSVSVNTGKYSWWRKGPTASDFIHDDVTPNFFRRANQYIQLRAKEKAPFFLYLPLPSPHTPILPAEKWQGKSGLNPYGDFVMMIDDYVGQLLNTVENAGITENTLIIFTSDNGCSPAAKINKLIEKEHYPNGPFRGHKADIFEGGHRVPFVAQWPAKILKGQVSDETICHTDLMATFAAITQYSLREQDGVDSYNLMPVLENKTRTDPIREATVHHSINGSFSIRQQEWKLILCPGSGGWSFPKPSDKKALENLPEYQLYNLKEDPAETNNLLHVETAKAAALKALLIDYITRGRSTPGINQENDAIDEEWKQLSFMSH